MPLAAKRGDNSAIHAHVTVDKLQLLTGWDLAALQQLWERGAFPKPLDPSTAEPVWQVHLIFDWLHVSSECQAEAARYIRKHHAGIYERSLKKSKAAWRDVEKVQSSAITDTETLIRDLENGYELTLLRPRWAVEENDEDDEDDDWNRLLRHWKVASYIPFQVANLKLRRACDAIDELRDKSGELVVKGSSFQSAFEEGRAAFEEYRCAFGALHRELAHLNALNDVAVSVLGSTDRRASAKAMRRRIKP